MQQDAAFELPAGIGGEQLASYRAIIEPRLDATAAAAWPSSTAAWPTSAVGELNDAPRIAALLAKHADASQHVEIGARQRRIEAAPRQRRRRANGPPSNAAPPRKPRRCFAARRNRRSSTAYRSRTQAAPPAGARR